MRALQREAVSTPELKKAQDALNTCLGYLRTDDGHPVRLEVSDALPDLRARLHGVRTPTLASVADHSPPPMTAEAV